MKSLQVLIAILLFFIPPVLARHGYRRLLTIGSLVVLTLVILGMTYIRFGFTPRFGWALSALVVYAIVVLVFTLEFTKSWKKTYNKRLHRIAAKSGSR
jgi:hypothetical protein